MQIRNFTLLFALCLMAGSCSQEPISDHKPAQKSINVVVGSDPGIGIKPLTALGEDGISITWTDSDTVAMWATSEISGTQFTAKPFAMWHYNAEFNAAKFTADIDPMQEDTYTYYAVSPRPQSVDGTLSSFSIPAEQSGVFDPRSAVMVATPVQGPALVEGDNSKAINLNFKHKVHILKITIPENRLGLPITALELKFPVDVVGTLTVDAADNQATGTLSKSSNTLMLNFKTPIDVGATVIATIAPVELLATDKIQIKAISNKKESKIATMSGKNFRESHTTPIQLTIPELYRCTRIVIQTDGDGTATLGEQIQNMILTAPEGVDLGGGSNVHTFAYNADNSYMLSYEGEFVDQLSGTELAVTYDSESAMVSSSFTMPLIVVNEINEFEPLAIPYLFEEDFSRITSNFSGSAATGNAAGTELSGYGLAGWYAGARSEGYTGTSVNLRSYSNFGGPYHSRIDSEALGSIKEGKSVTINLTFYADWKKNKSSSMKLIVGRTSGHSLNTSIDNSTTINMSNNSSASSTNITTQHIVNIPNVDNSQSIAWKTSATNGTIFNYENLYIDNIKASITK